MFFLLPFPPLRKRLEDVPPLVWMFVKQNEKSLGKQIDRISRKSMEVLQRYAWPGNCRELRNIVEHAMITCNGGDSSDPSAGIKKLSRCPRRPPWQKWTAGIS